MRIFFIIWFVYLLPVFGKAQETDPQREQQLESLAEKENGEPTDDAYLQQLDEYRRNRLDLNSISGDDLGELNILTGLQVSLFLSYRILLGKLVDIYELQAIPGWDIETIKALLPYVKVGDRYGITGTIKQRLHGGIHKLLFRTSEQLEKSKGYEKPVDTAASFYAGSRHKLFIRYNYNYRNLLQYGVLGDKDAGEQFFKGYQKYGFDFYSFHLFIKNMGIVKSLALGDFTVNMGQGLIQWQSLAFGKGAAVLSAKRQSSVLRPYSSAGEANFHRGVGITLQKGKFELTTFASFRKVSANLVPDTASQGDNVSSFETAGYHRTAAEDADGNSLRQTTFGANIRIAIRALRVGINGIQYYFSHDIKKQDEPYNLFALKGHAWNNEGLDYSYTYRNVHLFGEFAVDKNLHTAAVNGLLISLHDKADAVIFYRGIAKSYQSLYSDAFTENASPTNEKGFYTGISTRPFAGWRLDGYADVFYFPWLKYRVDAPAFGSGFFVQLFYQPNKVHSMYTRFKNESRQSNISPVNSATHELVLIPQQNWRTEYAFHANKQCMIRSRLEMVWYNWKQGNREKGFLALIDIFYHPRTKPLNGNMRLEYFKTGGYNSRVYAFESDLLYNYSIPVLYNKGFRYYINGSINLKKIFGLDKSFKMNLTGWIKWSQYLYPKMTVIGTGLDQYTGNKKSEVKCQLVFGW